MRFFSIFCSFYHRHSYCFLCFIFNFLFFLSFRTIHISFSCLKVFLSPRFAFKHSINSHLFIWLRMSKRIVTRGFQILGPNSSSPVAYCHEKIAMGKIALNWKNWAMVLSWIVIIHRNTIIFRFLKFIDTTIPCCVPIRHFVTPASVLYSRLLPPNIEPFPFASIDNFIKFVGSPSLRVAHRIIFPSVETPARWCPVNFYFLLYC